MPQTSVPSWRLWISSSYKVEDSKLKKNKKEKNPFYCKKRNQIVSVNFISDFISVRWTLDWGWRGTQWDGGLTGRSQSVSETCLALVSLWPHGTLKADLCLHFSCPLIPSLLLSVPLGSQGPCCCILLHFCSASKAHQSAPWILALLFLLTSLSCIPASFSKLTEQLMLTLCWLWALLPSGALNGVTWIFQSAIYIMLSVPRNMKGTPQLSDFAYPSQVESVLTAFTPQSPTFSAHAQFCLSDYHYLNFIQIQIIGSSTIFF